MSREQKFLITFKSDKEVFEEQANKALQGTQNNPDFSKGPVEWGVFNNAYTVMIAASPEAVLGNQAGLAIYRPLRLTVEGMMRTMALYAQPLIGNNKARRDASGLPLTKLPQPRPTTLNAPLNAKAGPGPVSGTLEVWGKPDKAADGILVEAKMPDGSFKEIAKMAKFKIVIHNLTPGEAKLLRVRYWNQLGTGPSFPTDLPTVAKQ